MHGDCLRVALCPDAVLPLGESLTGPIANIESLFPEWEVSGENWSETLAADGIPDIKFPLHVKREFKEYKGIKSMLGLDVEDPAVAAAAAADPKKVPPKKEAPKKGAKDAVGADLEEPATDETGRPLPRMFLDDAAATAPGGDNLAFQGFVPSYPFRRNWSIQQTDRKSEIESLRRDLAAAAASPEEAAASSQSSQIQQRLDLLVAASSNDAPNGPERDPCMCAAFRIVSRFAPSVLQSLEPSAASTPIDASSGMQYLWRSIYPRLPSGRPCYNPAGKYCVRLFLARLYHPMGSRSPQYDLLKTY